MYNIYDNISNRQNVRIISANLKLSVKQYEDDFLH